MRTHTHPLSPTHPPHRLILSCLELFDLVCSMWARLEPPPVTDEAALEHGRKVPRPFRSQSFHCHAYDGFVIVLLPYPTHTCCTGPRQNPSRASRVLALKIEPRGNLLPNLSLLKHAPCPDIPAFPCRRTRRLKPYYLRRAICQHRHPPKPTPCQPRISFLACRCQVCRAPR